ncbi:MAG: hypothetical protein MHM6MM_000316 [Cercozoa sp. M6MM]
MSWNSNAGYDYGVNTFSPEGRLFQVEYAISSIKLGSTALGIQTADGVILASEKRLTSPLLVPDSIVKISEIDAHIACAVSGLQSDARTLVDHCRRASQDHWFVHDEKMQVRSIAQSISDLSLGFGEGKKNKMSRPYGCSLLLGGVDDVEGAVLYHTDPSGTFTKYKAKSIGAGPFALFGLAYVRLVLLILVFAGMEAARSALQEDYDSSMTLEAAETLALNVLKQVMKEKISSSNVEVVSVTTEGIHKYTQEEIDAIIERLAANPLHDE